MTDDLVKRLRSPANVFYEYAADDGAFLHEAADYIEKLEAANNDLANHFDVAASLLSQGRDRIEKLEAALREIVAWPTTVKAKMVKIARKALEGKDD